MPKNRAEILMNAQVILAKRLNAKDWDVRDKKSSDMAVGSIIIALSSELAIALESGHLKPKDLDLDSALKTLEAVPYVVVDHSRTDGRPDCILLTYILNDQGLGGLGGRNDFIASDLPLVPIALLGEE